VGLVIHAFLARYGLALLAGLLLLGLVLWGPTACAMLGTEKAARKVAEGDAAALLDAVEVANDTATGQAAEAAAIAAEAGALADGVRAAPAGDSNDDADAAACSLRSYRDTPACVALRAQSEEEENVP
jgi:hypothetical protein